MHSGTAIEIMKKRHFWDLFILSLNSFWMIYFYIFRKLEIISINVIGSRRPVFELWKKSRFLENKRNYLKNIFKIILEVKKTSIKGKLGKKIVRFMVYVNVKSVKSMVQADDTDPGSAD